ncbi:uncharacterized protein LOC120594858 [Pteropus medius]|uniref:uncharacterized protein LOC120594858 n=1 Tax=Pteropus vampyrus TaxID=132908 RepID=UPI00196B1FBD|nr:uncharacterized protein LOC120594858 [Pteropus giganteus]
MQQLELQNSPVLQSSNLHWRTMTFSHPVIQDNRGPIAPPHLPGGGREQLQETYRVYTPIDPEAPENQQTINVAFATQAAPDIRHKLQKLEGFAGMNLSQLVEIAQKVFNNREAPDDPKLMAKIMVAAMQEERSGKTRARQGRSERGPLQKPGTQDYQTVQNLREVNKRVETIHPTVPNLYTLHNLDCTLLQYVDDLLLAAETEEICLAAIRDLLGTLEAFGYRVLAKKAQLCTQSVAYLRYTLEGGKRTLSRQRIEAILQIPVPTTKRQTYRNIHQPRVWELIVTETSEIVAQNITSHSTPEIRVDLCRLARDPLTIATAGHQLGSGSFIGRAFVGGGAYLGYKGGPGCGILLAEKSLLGIGLYICPQGISGSMRNRGLNCEGKGQFSCANWGCETISTIDNYKKQNDNHIELIRGPTPSTCSLGSYNPLIITIKTGSLGGQHYWLTG